MKNDIINHLFLKGAISGAILDASSPEAILHAYKYYDAIRKSNSDVDNIANNTNFTRDQILMVKNYIFFDEHKLENGYQRFEPDFFMAQSWQRLAFDAKNIQPHDLMLIKHELYEMTLVAQGIPYQEAHIKSNEAGNNYEKMCKEFYDRKKENNKDNKEIQKNIKENKDGQNISDDDNR